MSKEVSIKTASQLRDRLANLFDGIETGTIDHKKAREMSNAAGKMISTAKVQVEYFALRKEKPKIAFLAA